MGNTQVTKFHPVFVGASFSTPKTIKNVSGATIYGTYNQDALPSSTVKDIELTVGSEETVSNGVWLITASEVDTEIEVKNATPKVAVEPELPKESIAASKLEKNTLTGEQVNKELTKRRLILQAPFVIPEKTAKAEGETQYLLQVNTATLIKSAAKVANFSEGVPAGINFTEAPFKITGKTIKVILETTLFTNAVAATGNLKFGLAKATTIAGAEKKLEVTATGIEAVQTFTAPAAESALKKESEAALTNATNWFIGLEVTATETAAKSFITGYCQLFVNNE